MTVTHWLAAALFLSASPTMPQPAPSESPGTIDSTTTTEDVAIGNRGDRMTVDVSVGGQGPYRFLVDTGSERTVISRELAQRLQLAGGRATILHSVLGVNNVQTVDIPRLQVNSRVISVADAPALQASNIGADGLLGLDGLRSQRVLFNFKEQTMSITPSSRRAERPEEGTIIVRAKSRRGRLIFTDARVDGQQVAVIVDTGSQFTVGNSALKAALARRNLSTYPQKLIIETVTGEKLAADVAIIDRLDIDAVHLDRLPVAFAEAHIFRKLKLDKRPAILLGMNAMRAFDKISIDFAAKKVRFVLPQTGMRDDVRMAEAVVGN
jgi:predicted aspartyl protease